MPVICVCREKLPEGYRLINTTSRGKDPLLRQLSPFYLGPIPLHASWVALNMENAWQFSKVYPEHVRDGLPTSLYHSWSHAGWRDKYAQRYPMGKGAVPAFSWWTDDKGVGQKLSYVEARKKIYVPLYARAVIKTEAFAHLQQLFAEGQCLALWDFDAYNHKALGMTYSDVLNNPDRKMGHAFVLGMLLEQDPLVLELLS